MVRVVDLERARVEHLAAELLPELRERGQLVVGRDDVEDVERWRRAARRAARQLGEHIRTGDLPDGGAWAVLDRPVSDAERRRTMLLLDQAIRPHADP